MRAAIIAVLVLTSTPALATDDALFASQLKVAQIVTMAKTAPLLCPGIQADDPAIQALMHDAQITYSDIMDPARFGQQDELIAQTFAENVKADPRFCDKLFVFLGDRAHLLRR